MPKKSSKDGVIDLEAFLDRLARDGEPIVIERGGRPAAILSPYRETVAPGATADIGPAESESRLRAIMDRSPVEIGLKDADGRYVMVSRRFEELNGLTNDDIVGKTAYDIFPEETARAIEAHDAEVLRTGEVSEREIETPLENGIHTYLTVKFPIVDSAGRVTGIGAISSDITERKRGQRENEERLGGIFEQGSVGVAVMRADGIFVQVNPAYCNFIGRRAEELIGKHFGTVIHPDDLSRVTAHWDTVMAGDAVAPVNERRYRHKSGDVIWGLAGLTVLRDPDGGVSSYMVQVQDITERKRAEWALRDSEQRLRDFAEATSDWFWEMDADLRFTYLSDRVEAIAGQDSHDTIGKTRWEFAGVGPEDGKWRRHNADLMARVPFRDFRYERTRDDGNRQYYSISGKPVFDEQGEFKGYRGTGTSVTAEVEAQSRTEKAKARFFDAIENSTEAIALFDRDDKLVLCNSRYKEIVDRVVPGLLHPGILFERIVREGAGKGLYGEVEEDIERMVARRLDDHRNLPMVRQHCLGDGSWVQVREQRTSDGGVILVQTDITELRDSEARLRQAQKMEAVGQLTGGVAHDFNNLLGVIMGNAEMLAERIGETDPQLGAILRATRRGAELTNRLLAFSRRQALAPKSVDLDELVLSMTDLLGRTLGETIQITASKTPGLWRAAADPGQLENALMNLAINARDAMPGGGKLVVETVNMPLTDETVAATHGISTGDYIALLVTDNGQGMTPEVLVRAADPFFTTKGVGQGSGLGLSMVEGFARQSGGFMAIESARDAGTMVKVVLPRAQEDIERPASDRKTEEPKARGEMILVVEDDPDVRGLAVSILKRLDYRVVEAPDGRAALEILQKPEPIDLILTDVVLPGGLSGPEIVTKGRDWQPGVKALFMSGYATDVLSDQDRPDAAGELLNKPFRRAELAARVRDALDASETEF